MTNEQFQKLLSKCPKDLPVLVYSSFNHYIIDKIKVYPSDNALVLVLSDETFNPGSVIDDSPTDNPEAA